MGFVVTYRLHHKNPICPVKWRQKLDSLLWNRKLIRRSTLILRCPVPPSFAFWNPNPIQCKSETRVVERETWDAERNQRDTEKLEREREGFFSFPHWQSDKRERERDPDSPRSTPSLPQAVRKSNHAIRSKEKESCCQEKEAKGNQQLYPYSFTW